MGTKELTLEEIGAEFELIGSNLCLIGRDLRTGTLDPPSAVDDLTDTFKDLRAEFEALTAKVKSNA